MMDRIHIFNTQRLAIIRKEIIMEDNSKTILYWICAIVILLVIAGFFAKYFIVPMIKANAAQLLGDKLSVLQSSL